MKRLIVMLCLAVGLGILSGSCERNVPNIEFVNVVNHTSDFSGLIAALESQSKTLQQKLDLINEAIKNTNLTLEQKLAAIETAVKNGVATYEDMAGKMIAAINELKQSQADKLDALYAIMASNGASLAQKLADVKAALEAGFASEKDAINAMSTAIKAAIDAQTDAQKSAFAELKEAVEDGLVSVAAATAALQEALIEELNSDTVALTTSIGYLKDAVDAGFTLEAETLAALQQALVKEIQDGSAKLAEKIQALTDATAVGFEAETAMIETLKNQLIEELNNDTVAITDKLADVQAAIKAGFILEHATLEKLRIDLVRELRLNTMTLSQKLSAIQTAIETGLASETTAINELKAALIDALVGNNDYSISKKLDKLDKLELLNDINTTIGLLDTDLKAIDSDFKAAFGEGFSKSLLDLLEDLVDAVEKGADYSGIIEAIKSLGGITTGPITLFNGEEEIKEALDAKVDGETFEITLKTIGKWAIDEEATSLPEGWTVEPAEGNGNATVTVTVPKNETKDAKEATITFKSGENTAVLEVNQAKPWISVYPDKVEFVAKDAKPYNVGVSSNASWTVECSEDWITATKTEEGVVEVSVKDNTGAERRGTVTFKVNDEVSTTFTVVQKGVPAKITLDGKTEQLSLIGKNGKTCTYKLVSNYDWEVTYCPYWITVNIMSGTATDKGVEVNITVSKNVSGFDRTGSVIFSANGAEAKFTAAQFAH